MDARIIGWSGHLVGVEVIDNDGREHEISLDGGSGTVAVHVTDAYPADVDSRSPEETEHLRQAQRYAKYTLDRELDRTTRPARDTPDRLREVRESLASLSDEDFEATLGLLYDQLASHFARGPDRPVDLPPDLGDSDSVLYRQEIAVESGGDVTVSGLEAVYRDPYQARQRVEAGTPLADEADARLELQPHWLTGRVGDGHLDVESFRRFVSHHLACQIRDCSVGMGVDPPEDVRVRGPGKHAAVVRYRELALYPDYHDEDAAVFRR